MSAITKLVDIQKNMVVRVTRNTEGDTITWMDFFTDDGRFINWMCARNNYWIPSILWYALYKLIIHHGD